MASTDARPVPIKNVAYRAYFGIYKNDGTLITGASGLDSEVSKDGAAIADCTNEATEIGSTALYYLDLTSTEMNADSVTVLVKSSSTGAVPVVLSLYPEEAGDINVDVTAFGGTAGTFASGIPEVKINLPVGPIPSLGIIENGTLQSATSSSIIVGRAGMSLGDDVINGCIAEVIAGTGIGQCRVIVDFTGASDTLTVDPPFSPTLDNTSHIVVRAAPPAPTTAAYLPPVLVSVGTGTGQINASGGKVPATIASGDAAGILTTALTESYAADGAAGTLSQILFGLQAFLQERAVSGTTLTVKKLDGSTTAMTFTLSDATSPVSVTRAG